MARLPEEWIDEVVLRNDIVDIISEYVALKPSGKGFMGLCPFHNEKTPSFSVSPDKQLYHCFGCGEGGGIISFVMNIEKLEYIEAVKYLAERAGMPMPDVVDTNEYIRNKSYKEKLYELNRECARFYHNMLFSDEGKEALNYLKKRGLSVSTIKSFGIGYAPDSFDRQLNYLKSKGFAEKQLIDTGIVVDNTEKKRVYDRFRNRIMFPIIHPRGMVLGFGGRVLDDSKPKYLNSSDSPVFNKSGVLFGLNMISKMRLVNNIIITEGYMDVIALHQFGFRQAVASLGTSLTKDQEKLLSRYCSRVFIAYDGDTAGQEATLRGLDILYNAGCNVSVIKFPRDMDPDEVLKTYGPEYFNKLMDKSLSLVEYKLDRLRGQFNLNRPEEKVAFATEAATILSGVENLIERDVHIQKLEEITGIKSRIIHDQIMKIEGSRTEIRVKRNTGGNNRDTKNRRKTKLLLPSYIRAEKYLIKLMSQSTENANRILDGLDGHVFADEFHNEVLNIIKSLTGRNAAVTSANILSHVEDMDKAKELVEIFNYEMEYDNIDSFISDCLDQVKMRSIHERRQEIYRELAEAEKSPGDPEKYRMLLMQLEAINQKANKYRQERR